MKNVFFILLLFLTPFTGAYGQNNTQSLMRSGDWYKISVTQDGIYRITYAELREMGISNPADVRLYGSGGAMLPETADDSFADDLKEIPVFLYTGSDGIFNEGDYVLFYGQGPVVWNYDRDGQTFRHSLHLWDTRSFYFITARPGGKRIETEEPPQGAVTHEVATFDEHLYHETESVNLLLSGRHWFGETVSTSDSRTFSFKVPDTDLNEPVRLDVSFMSRNAVPSILEIYSGNQLIETYSLPRVSGYQLAAEARFTAGAFLPPSDNITVTMKLAQPENISAGGYLNYLRLHAVRKLNLSSSQLFFRNIRSAGEGNISSFHISNCTANTQVWDITDMHRIRRMQTGLSRTELSFKAATGSVREFVTFDPANGLLKPDFPDKNMKIGNQNLHSMKDVNMIIISHPDFTDASGQLADLHRAKDGLKVETVTTEQVYNEFSSGKQDPAAIRNFMKSVYENSSPGSFKYLLLMGDGSYDNKSNLLKNDNTNYVVTYQSENTVHSLDSYVSDDYYGILDNGETILDGVLKMGIGRLPVQTPEQAQAAVNKIRRYMEAGTDEWPNRIGLLADDGDNNLHTLQSESLSVHVNSTQPQYTVEKLYLDAFPQVVTVDGHRYPEVEQRLNDLMKRGCMLVNYIGHGNESGLADERIVSLANIPQWTNKIYPLFIAATCNMGRYDNSRASAGEQLVLHPDGGGIAAVAGTRLAYSSLNFQFNSRFFTEMFVRPDNNNGLCLGDILRNAKNTTGSSVNKLCFALLGDPALKMPVPSNNVRTVSINGKAIEEPQDTIKANSRVSLKGNITDKNGQILTGFNGTVHFSLFDKPRESNTLDNDNEQASPVYFTTRVSVLHKGKSTVTNGEFEASFIMPRDINYQYGFGKITYYARSEPDGDIASGAFDRFVTGGSEPAIEDHSGPEIRLFINDTLFRDGGMTNRNPELIALLRDESGINISEEGIGHEITAVLSNDLSTIYRLNPFYEAEQDSYRKGVVRYTFSDLPEGNYELYFTAWDVNNNVSRKSIRFQVSSSQKLIIGNLYNYPNPFSGFTNLYFEHNMPGVPLEAEWQIFNMSGRLLRSEKRIISTEGFTSGEFQWDGRDANGNRMQNGIYPYRVILRTSKGQKTWKSAKMLIVN